MTKKAVFKNAEVGGGSNGEAWWRRGVAWWEGLWGGLIGSLVGEILRPHGPWENRQSEFPEAECPSLEGLLWMDTAAIASFAWPRCVLFHFLCRWVDAKGRRKAVRDRLALQGGTGDFP